RGEAAQEFAEFHGSRIRARGGRPPAPGDLQALSRHFLERPLGRPGTVFVGPSFLDLWSRAAGTLSAHRPPPGRSAPPAPRPFPRGLPAHGKNRRCRGPHPLAGGPERPRSRRTPCRLAPPSGSAGRVGSRTAPAPPVTPRSQGGEPPGQRGADLV